MGITHESEYAALSQVNESWLQQGVPSSQTFKPTQKDKGKPSVYDGDIIVSAEGFLHSLDKRLKVNERWRACGDRSGMFGDETSSGHRWRSLSGARDN